MSLINNSQSYEIILPYTQEDSVKILTEAVNNCGKILDDNGAPSFFRFKIGMSFFRNPVKFTANLSKEPNGTRIVFSASSFDGAIGFNSTDRAYQALISEISLAKKQFTEIKEAKSQTKNTDDDFTSKIEKLNKLFDTGIITEIQYEKLKEKVIKDYISWNFFTTVLRKLLWF